MAKQVVLVTGANGIVGSELVRSLLRMPEAPKLYLLVRGEPAEVEAKARWLRAWLSAEESTWERVRVLRGDVTADRAGLGVEEYDDLARELTGIVHSAASTSFHQSAEQAGRSNITGTRRVLELATRCPRLDRFGLVSTAYVAGTRTGIIREDELDVGIEYVNEYERSKAIAEEEASRAGLPLATYRLGIVVGRRNDGRIARMSGIYPIWRILHQGLLSMIPGDPAQVVDLVPADFACDAIAHLFQHAFVPGARYHVCAGAARSLSLGELVPAMEEAIAVAEPAWRQRGYPRAVNVAPDAFERFMEAVEHVAHVGLRSVVRQLRMFTRQLEYPKTFDTSRFDRDLGSSGLELEHARHWLPTLAAHAVATGFEARGWEAFVDG